MTPRDYYRLLGVSRTASTAEIRAAYARLVKRHHPDVAGRTGPMTQRLHDYQRAYRCLSDAVGRNEHDRRLREEERLHILRQQRLQSRIRRHDRRHPRAVPNVYRAICPRKLLLIAAGVSAAICVSVVLLG